LSSKTAPPTGVGEDEEKKKPGYAAGRMQASATTLENNMEAS
jgi:hypothetical protein